MRAGLLLAGVWVLASGCVKGDETPPVTGSAPVVVDAATGKVSLDTNRVPSVETCAPGLFVRRTATGWECTQAPATPWNAIPGRPDAFAPEAHRHAVAEVDGAAASADLDLVAARTAALEARSELLDQEFVNRVANGSFEAVGADGLPLRWEKTGTGQATLAAQNTGASSGTRALSFNDTDAGGSSALRQVLVADAARAAPLSGRVFTASVLAKRVVGSAAGEICLRDSATSKTCTGLAVAGAYARAVVRHVVSIAPEFLEVTLGPTKLPEETAAYVFDDVMVTGGSAAPAFTASPADRFAADGATLALEDNHVFAIRNGGVTTGKLADRSVTAAKVDAAGAAPGQALVAGAGGSAAWGSVPWSSVSSVPAGFADGIDNDTQYTAGAGLVLSGTRFSLAPNATLDSPTLDSPTLNSPVINAPVINSPTLNSPVVTGTLQAGHLQASSVAASGAMSAAAFRGFALSSNRSAVGLEHDILLNAMTRYAVTQTGPAPLHLPTLFDGAFDPSYSEGAPTPANPQEFLIEGLPGHHVQAGAWIGWSTRYWPARHWKLEVFDTYGGANVWRTVADYTSGEYGEPDFAVRVADVVVSKIRLVVYDTWGEGGRLGISEIFFILPEYGAPYHAAMPSVETFTAHLSNAEEFTAPAGNNRTVMKYDRVAQNTAGDVFELDADGTLRIKKAGVITVTANADVIAASPYAVMDLLVSGSLRTRTLAPYTNGIWAQLSTSLSWKVGPGETLMIASYPNQVVSMDNGEWSTLTVQWIGIR